ncbi:MAG TPA: type VI secretion system baseplate subunit TssG, partial [Trinickia sp.]|nr:type VI secretion system baseplate subunit TssG [Trinickia sp.]
MGSARRRAAPTVKELVFGEPERIDVFQLVRLLRVYDASHADTNPEREHRQRPMRRLAAGEAHMQSFGRFAKRLRFRADLSPAFPGSEVTACRLLEAPQDSRTQLPLPGMFAKNEAEAERFEIRTPNYCVASELGPLPEPFLEWVRDRLRDDDGTFAAFLDVFNHRVNVLRHRLKESQDVALDHAAPQNTLQADYLASIAGIASPAAQAQIALPRRAWLGMSATLADPRRSVGAAVTALRQYLGVRGTRLTPLAGDWRTRAASQWSSLG